MVLEKTNYAVIVRRILPLDKIEQEIKSIYIK